MRPRQGRCWFSFSSMCGFPFEFLPVGPRNGPRNPLFQEVHWLGLHASASNLQQGRGRGQLDRSENVGMRMESFGAYQSKAALR